MTTEPRLSNADRMISQEREISSARHQKVQAFIQDVMRLANSVLTEQKVQQEAVEKFESRPYQLEAWDALWKAREEGKDRGLIHLATGLGKTSVAVFDYARFRKEQEEKGETARALFVVHQNAILDQADERFNEVLPHLLPGVGMSRLTNQSNNLPTGEVVFASFQALNRGASRFDPHHFDYIVYDEAHHIEAKTYKKVVEYFHPKFQLGLTATPERGDDKDITEHFGEALYTKTLPEGIAEEHLADVHYRLMLDKQAKQMLQNGFKPKSMKELKDFFDFEPRLEDIAAEIKVTQQELREKTGLEKIKTIIFNADIQKADEMAALMSGESYHSGRNRKDKGEVLRTFRNGDLETIVTRDMFNEGVDVPDALLLVFCRTTQSKTIFEQQLGRGLRKTADKNEVTVLDFVANVERIRLIRELGKVIRRQRVSEREDEDVDEESTEEAEGLDDTDLTITIGKSDFEFGQELIDILELYDYFVEENGNKIDWSSWTDDEIIELAKQISPDKALTIVEITELSRIREFPSFEEIRKRFKGSINEFRRACGYELIDAPDGVLSLEGFANVLNVHTATLKTRIEKLGIAIDSLPTRSFNGYRARAIDQELQEAIVSNAPEDTSALKPFFEIIKEVGIHKHIATEYLREYMPNQPKLKFGNVASYAFTLEDEKMFLAIPEVNKLLSLGHAPEGTKLVAEFAAELGTSAYKFKKFLEQNSIVPIDYRKGGRPIKGLNPDQQEAIRQIWTV